MREGPRGALEAVWWSPMERRQDEGLMRDLSNSNTPSRNPRTPAASRTVQLGGEDVADASFGWTNSRVPAIDLTLTMTGAAVGTLCSPSMRLVFEGDGESTRVLLDRQPICVYSHARLCPATPTSEGLAAAKRAMAALQEQVQPVSETAACADKEDDEGFDLPVLVRAFLQVRKVPHAFKLHRLITIINWSAGRTPSRRSPRRSPGVCRRGQGTPCRPRRRGPCPPASKSGISCCPSGPCSTPCSALRSRRRRWVAC